MSQKQTTESTLKVKPHPGSYCDRRSRLFTSQGRIIRGLTELGAQIYHDLVDKGILQQLLDEGLLVDTWECEQALPGWSVVLEHKRVPFVIAPSEWSAEMFYEAGLVVLRIQEILTEYGYTIYDPHPWNVLFDGTRPVYIDFGSIRPAASMDRSWHNFGTVEQSFIHSLRILAAGQGRAFRGLFRDYNHFPTRWEIEALAGPPSLQRRLRDLARRVQNRLDYRRQKLHARRVVKSGGLLEPQTPDLPTEQSLKMVPGRMRFINRMRRWFEKFEPARHPELIKDLPTQQPLDSPDALSGWQSTIAKWIDEHQPKSVIDIGEGGGQCARMAAGKGAMSVHLEPDEDRANALYRLAKQQGSMALPIVANPRYPTPGYGIKNTELPAAISRLRGEMVIAMGMTVEYREWHYPPWMSAKMVLAFTSRWAVFEFVPGDEEFLDDWAEMQWGDYSPKTFIDAFIEQGAELKDMVEKEDGSALILIEHESRRTKRNVEGDVQS